jgi:hypothetical protein
MVMREYPRIPAALAWANNAARFGPAVRGGRAALVDGAVPVRFARVGFWAAGFLVVVVFARPRALDVGLDARDAGFAGDAILGLRVRLLGKGSP